jgi:hypothetical protein
VGLTGGWTVHLYDLYFSAKEGEYDGLGMWQAWGEKEYI